MKKKTAALLMAIGIVCTSISPSAVELDIFTDGTEETEVEFENPEPGLSQEMTEESESEESQGQEENPLTGPEETEEVPEIVGNETAEAASSKEYSIKIDKKVVHLGYDREKVEYDLYNDYYDYMEPQDFVNITNTGTKTVHLKIKNTRDDGTVYNGTLTLKPGETYLNEYYVNWGHYAGTYVRVMDITDESGQIHEQVKCITTVTGPRDMFDIKEKELKLKSKYEGEAGRRLKFTVTNTSKETYTPIALTESKNSAFVISKFSKDILRPGESGTFTILGRTKHEAGLYKEKIKICTSKEQKDYKLLDATIRVYPKVKSVHLEYPSAVYRNGTTVEHMDSFLGWAILELSDGKTTIGNIEWDIKGSGYKPENKKEQNLKVYGTVTLPPKVGNADGVSLKVVKKVKVRAYEPMKKPDITKQCWVYGNRISVRIKEYIEEADSYEYCIGKSGDFIEKGGIISKREIVEDAYSGGYFENLDAGIYYCAARGVKTESGKKTYTEWSDVQKVQIKKGKPKTPVRKSVRLSGNNVKVIYDNISKEDAYECVLSTDTQDFGDGIHLHYDNTQEKELLFAAVPAGTYYLRARARHAIMEDGEIVYYTSDWTTQKKIKIRARGPKKQSPDVKVDSKRNLTVSADAAAGAVGYEIRVGRNAMQLQEQFAVNTQTLPINLVAGRRETIKDGAKKISVTFKSLPKGNYYVAIRQYSLYEGEKAHSRWETRYITVK